MAQHLLNKSYARSYRKALCHQTATEPARNGSQQALNF